MKTLVLSDRRSAGAYPVTVDGAVVASIRNRRLSTRFEVEDANGAALCAGSAGLLGMSNQWRVTRPDGAPLLEVHKAAIRARAEVRLADGRRLTVLGGSVRRAFEVRDGDTVVLAATPTTSSMSLHPHEYAVEVHGDLSLAETIAVVHVWRLLQKRDSSSAAATVAATGA